MKRSHVCRAIVGAWLACCAAGAFADVVGDWNETLVGLLLADKLNALLQSRHAALVHVAMADAVNAVEPRHTAYAAGVPSAPGASPTAAAAAAAHASLAAIFPHHRAKLDAALQRSLAAIGAGDGGSVERGIATGERAAAALLARRADDASTVQAAYQPSTAPDAWTPTADGALGVRWGLVAPWALTSGSQFRPAAPPAITSDAFKRDYLEVAAVGAKNSPTRSAEQTNVARFWIASGPVLWSQAARQWSDARALPLAESARLFALLHLAGADALTACWDAKYHYRNFRPQAAIRAGVGRADLAADPGWESVIPAPPFPAYPSGHACYGGAAAAVLESVFGSGELPAATLKSPTAQGFERRYARVGDIAAEASDARIWGGIHWRSDQTAGDALGRRVGAHALATALLWQGRPGAGARP